MRARIFVWILMAGGMSGSAFGQCTVNLTTGGTQCQGPLNVLPGVNEGPTSVITLAPATAAAPCDPGATPIANNICIQKGQVTVDFGDGKGYVSLKGDKGDKGDPGAQGVPGQNGSNGTNGANGKDGTNGSNGSNGVSPTVAVGTVTTLPPGSKATVINTGSPTGAVFNFAIPAGAAGTINFPITVTITCPRGSGAIVTGWTTKKCTLSQ